MNDSIRPWVWLGVALPFRLYVDWVRPNRGGYICRFVRKLLRVGKDPMSNLFVFLAIYLPLIFGVEFMSARDSIKDIVFWSIYILIALDDYFNDDNDLWKKLKAAKNRIKWKMVLPASQPVRDTA